MALYLRGGTTETVGFGRVHIPETWTNMPAAETRWSGSSTSHSCLIDMRRFKEGRMSVGVAVASSAGSVLRLKYSLAADYTVFANLLADVAIDVVGVYTTGWLALPVATCADLVLLSLWGQGGDGAADPQIRGPQLELR